MTPAKDIPILVVGGAGTFGSSTALHLSRRGYTNIHILDPYALPSQQSAGNDLNKICGNDYSNGMYARLASQAIDAWKTDPLFTPHFHMTGKLNGAFGSQAKLDRMRSRFEKLVSIPGKENEFEWLETEEEIVARAPHLRGADIKGWKAIFNAGAGWVAAADAITAIGKELQSFGVKTSFGPSGTFKKPIISDDGKTWIGVETEDGSKWFAERIIMATGAWSPTLVDLEGQCVSKCWVYAHLKLTDEESEWLKSVPVVYNGELGFFFEPRDNILKLCNEFPGFTRKVPPTTVTPYPGGSKDDTSVSVPRSHAKHPTDFIPKESQEDIRRLIKTLLPRLDDGRPFVGGAMCWCTDMPDANWLITEDPRWSGVIWATGDSGHGFKYLPIIGSYISDLFEGKLDEELKKTWAWRPGHGDPEGTGRKGEARDLKDLDGWEGSDPRTDV